MKCIIILYRRLKLENATVLGERIWPHLVLSNIYFIIVYTIFPTLTFESSCWEDIWNDVKTFIAQHRA